MKPLVSILISAYNAQEWIVEMLQSAIAQTWPRKEIILVDDGSTDATAELAEQFVSQGVTLLSTENRGLSAGLNYAYQHCQGDYIQFLDADDLLAPDKIERQLAALRGIDSERILLSSPWAPFYYRTSNACFVRNSLWQDLSPTEWLFRKLSENIHMQNATWLVSRKLAEAAGPWDASLHYDQDGEYFARVLLASERTRFVRETGIFYRITSTNRVSHIGDSNEKKNSLFRSMKLHIHYLRSLEDSERVRKACLTYMQNWSFNFYPERPDIIAELQNLAGELHGHLEVPSLRRKYDWIRPVFGWSTAKWAQSSLPHLKVSWIRQYDKTMYKLENRTASLPMQASVNVIQRD
jgi:glycosyltransferase involved in cell wall biosynthesis